MEEAVPPFEEENEHPTTLNTALVKGITISLALHLVAALVLLGIPGGGEPARQAVTYVDLNSVPSPQPTPPPAKVSPPEPAPEPVAAKSEAIPLPDTQPVPEQAPIEEPKPAAQQPQLQQPEAAPERSRTMFGMGLTKGYFKSLSDGDSLRVNVKEYYLEMLQGINERWWLEQRDEQVRPIVVSLTIARNGAIVRSTILQSSGNIVYDRAVQKSLESAGPLPPLPESYADEFFEAPVRLVPPLNLLAW